MATRGRGRGLAAETSKKTKRQPPSPRTPKSTEELAEYLYSLNDGNIKIHGTEFADMVLRFVDNDESKLVETVDLIFRTTVESRDYSTLGSTVCRFIADRESQDVNPGRVGASFSKKLLQRFQSELKNSKEIRAESIELWLGIFAFFCEVYCNVKAATISVVGKAIMDHIDSMLANPDTIDDEIITICSKLKVCGKSLEEQDSQKMEDITNMLRKQVISSKSSCQRRCVIMELIELKQLGWNDSSGKLDNFYVDAITDAIVEDEVGGN